MPTAAENIDTAQTRLEQIHAALAEGDLDTVRSTLEYLHPAEISNLLESLPVNERTTVWELVDPRHDGDILLYVTDHVRDSLIHTMDHHELVAAAEGLDTDDLADLLPEMPEQVIEDVMQSLTEQNRQRLQAILTYAEDSAGGLMNTDVVTIRPDITLDVVLRYLRLLGQLPQTTDRLMVVNREGDYLGMLSLTDLLTHLGETCVNDILDISVEGIRADTPASEVSALFKRLDLVTAPVVDDTGKLLGRITIDDVVDVIVEKAEHDFLGMAGLNEEEDIFAPVLASSLRRAVWLGVNLLTAFLAAWVIGQFGATIEKLVALAILMPVVASMGGIAGSQTLTLVIRAMALGQISTRNTRKLIFKEVLVGLVNGAGWALVIAIVASFWFASSSLGTIIAIAIIINLLAAALSGAAIPILLKRYGIDPSLAGSVILTTITDVVGFFAFLGLATLFLV